MSKSDVSVNFRMTQHQKDWIYMQGGGSLKKGLEKIMKLGGYVEPFGFIVGDRVVTANMPKEFKIKFTTQDANGVYTITNGMSGTIIENLANIEGFYLVEFDNGLETLIPDSYLGAKTSK